MSKTFKCKTSGQTVTFVNQVDIDSMKGHDGYEEVTEQTKQDTKATEEAVLTTTAKKTAKKSVDTVTSEEV